MNTFDIPSSKKNAQSQLTQQLDTLLYQRQKEVYSFTDYRLSMTNPDLDNVSQSHIDDLFSIINSLFSTTGKTIRINERNEIVFDKKTVALTIEQLSSGEKQMLILLFILSNVGSRRKNYMQLKKVSVLKQQVMVNTIMCMS